MSNASAGASCALAGDATIGFVGLGVMGEPMCANLAQRSGRRVLAYDLRAEARERLVSAGAMPVDSLLAIAIESDVIILSLPHGDAVTAVLLGPDGLLGHLRSGQTVVDTSTSPVALTRDIAATFEAKGIRFADAPVARTREAARLGKLSIMVGADTETYLFIEPILRAMGTDIVHCGPAGSGQTVKLLNNMVLFQNVMAIAEAIGVARRNDIAPSLLLDALMNGSADSFALRNHGLTTMIGRTFPERAFSTRYAKKDLSYVLDLARDAGIRLLGAELVMRRLDEAEAAGQGECYFPAILNVIDPVGN